MNRKPSPQRFPGEALYRRWALLLLALPLGAEALPNFSAHYDLSIRGIHAGQMKMNAVLTPKSYMVDTKTEPSLPAKMLGYGPITEMAQGAISNQRLLPQQYWRQMEGNEKYQLRYHYDLKKKNVEAVVSGQPVLLHYQQQIPLDTLALIIQALLDEERQQPAASYTLLSEDKIRSYKVEKLKDERWQDDQNRSITVKVYRQTHANRRTMIYLAENPLRLVKLQQIKNDQSLFVLKLTHYKTL